MREAGMEVVEVDEEMVVTRRTTKILIVRPIIGMAISRAQELVLGKV